MNADAKFPNVPMPLQKAMTGRGFSQLTLVQQQVLHLHSEGCNLRISSQTGSGKTIAIGLALGETLQHIREPWKAGPLALVVAPTRELAVQIQGELSWLYAELKYVKVSVVTGGTDIFREKKALRDRPVVLVGTPGRLLDHCRQKTLKLNETQHVILDEADQMLDMGFKDELDSIVELLPSERKSHLISATFPKEVKRLADRFQPDAVVVEGTKLGAPNQDIEHIAYRVRSRERYGALVNSLLLAQGERCLIFVRRRMDASDLAEMLASDGFSAMPFSGDLSQSQRTRTLNAFRKGVVNTLVATDVAARGIDVADISSVIHRDLPMDSETYTHRSGRTGRAGKKGKSVLLVPPAGERRIRRLLGEASIEATWQSVPQPKKIEKTMVKRARRKVHALMKEEPQLSEHDLDYAKSLLDEYDARTLVGLLMELAVPVLPRKPASVAEVDADRKEGRGKRDRSNDNPRRERHKEKLDNDYVPFVVQKGRGQGANTKVLLAKVCDRGQFSSRYVGAITVLDEKSIVDISVEVADAFEEAPPAEGKHESWEFTRMNKRGSKSKSKREGSEPRPRRKAKSGRRGFDPRGSDSKRKYRKIGEESGRGRRNAKPGKKGRKPPVRNKQRSNKR